MKIQIEDNFTENLKKMFEENIEVTEIYLYEKDIKEIQETYEFNFGSTDYHTSSTLIGTIYGISVLVANENEPIIKIKKNCEKFCCICNEKIENLFEHVKSIKHKKFSIARKL